MTRMALTTPQANRLQELETEIQTGLDTFFKVGRALIEIRDSKLYRQKYDTFVDYVNDRWSFKSARAYQLMQAVKLNDELTPKIDTTGLNPNQLQEIGRVPKGKRVQVVKEARRIASREDRPPQLRDFKEAVKPHLPADTRWADLVARIRSKEILSALSDVSKLQGRAGTVATAIGRRAECIALDLEELAELISDNAGKLDTKVLAK